MEYRTVSSKLPIDEYTLFRGHCEKKGVTPANLIRELILMEMKITVPHTVAGKNIITYDKNADSFTWSIELDTGMTIKVLRKMAPSFIENLFDIIKIGLNERNSFTHKMKRDSIAVPSNILRREQ